MASGCSISINEVEDAEQDTRALGAGESRLFVGPAKGSVPTDSTSLSLLFFEK